jgi:2'-5' RNA ligase
MSLAASGDQEPAFDVDSTDDGIEGAGDASEAASPSASHGAPLMSPVPPLYHHWTVCVVPPPSSTSSSKEVWEAITEARTRLKDPGLYRWPPHVNLLYPFVDCYRRNEGVTKGGSANNGTEEEEEVDGAPKKGGDSSLDSPSSNSCALVRRDVLDKVRCACAKIEPFTVQLRRLGTFGSSKRGVLWLDPRCVDVDDNDRDTIPDALGDDCGVTDAESSSPLVRLQRLLEEEFPYCTTQRTAGNGSYRPHMTLSHFSNLEDALQAQAQTEAWWSQLSSLQTDFVVDRIYILTRKGDDGQFERVAEVRLGSGEVTKGPETIKCFAPDEARFPDMPKVEYDWVREERMALKKRRNGGGRWRRRRGRRSNSRSEQRSSSADHGDSTTTTTAEAT